MSIGKRLPRLDAIPKATGQALFSVDFTLPKMLYGKIIRSPFPHAKILSIDTTKAQRLMGVKAILTGKDLQQMVGLHELGPFYNTEISHIKKGTGITVEEHVLCTDKVRFVGDEMAAVAAVDEDIAQEVLDLIGIEYEELPALFDPVEAMKSDSPKIHDVNRNIAANFNVTRGEGDFKDVDYIFEDSYRTPSVHQTYLEPVACLASFDSLGKLTFWISSMDPSGLRISLAKVLNMPEGMVRVIQSYVGGAFGGKIKLEPIHSISALLAKKAGKPVKIVNTREEELLATRPRLPAYMEIKTGVKKDGRLMTKEVNIVGDNGAYIAFGPMIISQMIVLSEALYKIPNVKAEAKLVFTNKPPIGAFRGFGNAQMFFALETHIERIAKELGMDPMELRLKNCVKAGDKTIHGWQIGSCGLRECIEKAAETIQWRKKRETKEPFHGVGMACCPYVSDARLSAGFAGSVAYINALEDGRVQIISGEADYGQGVTNVMAQVANEELGISLDKIQVSSPDSDITPFAMGPWGLRLTISAGNAVRLAALDLKQKFLEIASEELEVNPEDLELKDGRIFVKEFPEKAKSIAEIAKIALYRKGGSALMGKGVDEPDTELLNYETLYGNISSAYTFATQMVEVKVDIDTGMINPLRFISAHDLGRAINPMAAEGQVEGGIVQGIGFGLMEELAWIDQRIANSTLLDYKIPTSLESPGIETILVETYEPKGPYGAKGLAMPPLIMAAPALANAIYDALGIRIKELPITPERILNALEASKG